MTEVEEMYGLLANMRKQTAEGADAKNIHPLPPPAGDSSVSGKAVLINCQAHSPNCRIRFCKLSLSFMTGDLTL